MIQQTILSFLSPYRPIRHLLPPVKALDAYDIVAGTTLLGHSLTQYWRYPTKDIQRPDVEVFASLTAVLWHVFANRDLTIFVYLWIISFVSFMTRQSFLEFGNDAVADRMHIPIHMGGQMSLLLLLMGVMQHAFD